MVKPIMKLTIKPKHYSEREFIGASPLLAAFGGVAVTVQHVGWEGGAPEALTDDDVVAYLTKRVTESPDPFFTAGVLLNKLTNVITEAAKG